MFLAFLGVHYRCGCKSVRILIILRSIDKEMRDIREEMGDDLRGEVCSTCIRATAVDFVFNVTCVCRPREIQNKIKFKVFRKKQK